MSEKFEGFVYMDIDNPMVAWNVVRGNYYTPSCLPQSERAGALSFWMANLLRRGGEASAIAELKLEKFRRRYFPLLPSRLEALFVFDEVESALSVSQSGGWGGHFKDECLTDAGVAADCWARLDANWITLMRDENQVLVEDWEKLAWKYWAGDTASNKPMWECLVNGYVTTWGTELKLRAYYELQSEWASSIRLLEVSANLAQIGSRDGAILPYATQSGDRVSVDFYIRMVDAKRPDWCDHLADFLKNGGDRVCRLGGVLEDLVCPDLRLYSFQRSVSELNALHSKVVESLPV